MDGHIGSIKVRPDQMQMLSSILVIVLLPLFQFVIYPCVACAGLRLTPLRKMAIGQFLTGFAFVIAGVLQNIIEQDRNVKLNGRFQIYLSRMILISSVPHIILQYPHKTVKIHCS